MDNIQTSCLTLRSGCAQVLLVEDSEPDVVLVDELFVQGGLAGELYVVRDGVEALAFLRHEAPYQAGPRPDLILLDLHMPRMNGLELLDILKTDPHLMTIPVAMLTTSAVEESRLRACEAHAAFYLVKPLESLHLIRYLPQRTAPLTKPPSPGQLLRVEVCKRPLPG